MNAWSCCSAVHPGVDHTIAASTAALTADRLKLRMTSPPHDLLSSLQVVFRDAVSYADLTSAGALSRRRWSPERASG